MATSNVRILAALNISTVALAGTVVHVWTFTILVSEPPDNITSRNLLVAVMEPTIVTALFNLIFIATQVLGTCVTLGLKACFIFGVSGAPAVVFIIIWHSRAWLLKWWLWCTSRRSRWRGRTCCTIKLGERGYHWVAPPQGDHLATLWQSSWWGMDI